MYQSGWNSRLCSLLIKKHKNCICVWSHPRTGNTFDIEMYPSKPERRKAVPESLALSYKMLHALWSTSFLKVGMSLCFIELIYFESPESLRSLRGALCLLLTKWIVGSVWGPENLMLFRPCSARDYPGNPRCTAAFKVAPGDSRRPVWYLGMN